MLLSLTEVGSHLSEELVVPEPEQEPELEPEPIPVVRAAALRASSAVLELTM